MTQEWMGAVTLDMLPDAHRKFAEVIGVEATLKLCSHWGGDNPYVPLIDTVYSAYRKKMIREDFQRGVKVATLARQYGMAERSVYELVADLQPNQISLFDDALSEK